MSLNRKKSIDKNLGAVKTVQGFIWSFIASDNKAQLIVSDIIPIYFIYLI